MLDVHSSDEITRFARQPSIVVRVDEAKGSTPRVAGTMMLVSDHALLGTIGGGQLEFMAIEAARTMLAAGQDAQELAIPLGPAIGQCCGGHVVLSLKRLDREALGDLFKDAKDNLDAQPEVLIFGAGHVGRALALAFAPLPLTVRLIDSRENELARADLSVQTVHAALPENLVRNAKAGSAYIMMTHDHALDFLLTHEALARGDAAYVGMIGSKTKRATFASWLREETGTDALLQALTMPIGISSLTDKRPAVIAAMVAAQVMEAVGTHQTAIMQEKAPA